MDFNENGLTKKTKPTPAPQPLSILSPPKELQSSLARRSQRRPAPLRPRRPDESQIPQELLSPGMGLRQIRSADAYTPPFAPRIPLSPEMISPTTVAPLPPRRSSRRRSPYSVDQPRPGFSDFQSTQPAAANNTGPNPDWDHLLPLYNPRPGQFREQRSSPQMQPMMGREPVPFSVPQHSPLFSPPLEKVPEEPEGFSSPRHSREIRNNLALRHAKSSPNMSRSNSSTRLVYQTMDDIKLPEMPKARAERPVSQGSDTLGDLSRRSFIISLDGDATLTRLENRDTNGTDSTNDSWEDDIDFCYRYAAEADCEFDWNDVSKFLEEELNDEHCMSFSISSGSIMISKKLSGFSDSSEHAEKLRNHSFFHQSIIVGMEGLPELDYQSSHNGSTNSLSITTPHGCTSNEPFKPSKVHDGVGITSPDLPPIDLRGVTDSDHLYDAVMVSFNLKEARQQQLPTLEPKAYSPVVSQKSTQNSPVTEYSNLPVRRSRAFSNDRTRAQLPPPPTSAPTSSPPQLPLTASMSKDLPPLPPVSPAPLRMDHLVLQLRSPELSPNESYMDEAQFPFRSDRSHMLSDYRYGDYTPPSSTKPSPVPEEYPPKPLVRRQATRRIGDPIVKVQDVDAMRLSRSGSEDTIMTTIYVPSTPPDSPIKSCPKAPIQAEVQSYHPHPWTGGRQTLRSSPSMPVILSEGKRSVSDSEIPNQPKSPRSYSLFPQPPTRPRRSTEV